MIGFITGSTCGEACWHAKEEVCRCSCGGRNHGCLKTKDGVRPARTAKIDGHVYTLKAVGPNLFEVARPILREAGFRDLSEPFKTDNGWHQYYYVWGTKDPGSPVRIKFATPAQIAKWEELAAYRDTRYVELMWVRNTMPQRPSVLRIDTKTGLPSADQLPPLNII